MATLTTQTQEILRLQAENDQLHASLRAREIELAEAKADFARACQSEAREIQRMTDLFRQYKHAGLEYLATEIDWAAVVSYYGIREAVDLVQRIAALGDAAEVEQAVAEFFSSGDE